MTICALNPPGFRKLSHSSVMRNDAFMHCEGLNGKCMYTCGFRINANLVKEGIVRINAK